MGWNYSKFKKTTITKNAYAFPVLICSVSRQMLHLQDLGCSVILSNKIRDKQRCISLT